MRIRAGLAPALFHAVKIILLPIAVVPYFIWVAKAVLHSRRSGLSATIFASFYTRWMQHKLGTRRDEACERLMAVLPNVSRPALRLVTAPTLVAHALTGYVPKIYRYPYSGDIPMVHQSAGRTTLYDEALERHLGSIGQLVVLGAGLDTRAFRLPPEAGIRCFEVDMPKTQAFKREMLVKAGLDSSRIVFVPADFMKENWFERLVGAGFDPEVRSFFLWEAVTMYLDRDAVESTLRAIAGTVPGTVVGFDYFSSEIIESRSLFMRYARAVLKLTGERWVFGIDNTPPVKDRVERFLRSCGLVTREQRNFGREKGSTRAPAGFVVGMVPDRAVQQ
ncbi:MAG: class I SAM-dependent methyltransferase [Desulfobacteraceae bacterium]|nr:class I SAM-dependent methyltransferase [Desulfobacteraceae bacterium]